MSIDMGQIELSDVERRLLAEAAERTGKFWTEVLREALLQYTTACAPPKSSGAQGESWYDTLSRHGLVGCLHGGPPDLSTDPRYMEGFGEGASDH